ncbi:hypothetical protein, partial [Bradyrhizobium sp. CCBAU 21362]|uniref:hypothetical protein n=1 Tax=Bradyrhizobium sp. CCBAU 21362 TaxID=1325082 RepID=UPI0023067D57
LPALTLANAQLSSSAQFGLLTIDKAVIEIYDAVRLALDPRDDRLSRAGIARLTQRRPRS